MGIPYLNSDESILLSTHNIIVDAVVSEAILTNRRLLIVDMDSTRSRHKEIPFAAIETVTTMESGSGDPAMSLAILTKEGGTEPMHLVYTQQPRSQRTGERDEWAQKIKEQIALLPPGTAPEYVDFSVDESEDLKKLIGYTSEGAPAAPEDKNIPAAEGPGRRASSSPRSRSPAGPGKNMIIAAAAIVVVILLIAGAVFIYPALVSPKAGPVTPAPTPVPTTEATMAPVLTPAVTAEPTPVITPEQTPVMQPTAVTTSPAQPSIPENGVWVRVTYDKEYSGTIGTSGWLREVSGTGEHFYQIPARSTDIVDISIQKLDSSGLGLTVEIFNNGELIQSKTMKTPMGTIGLNVGLKTATVPTITPTLTP